MTEHTRPATWDDLKAIGAYLLDLEGLLKTKQGVRPKDQLDAAVLSAALQELPKQRP